MTIHDIDNMILRDTTLPNYNPRLQRTDRPYDPIRTLEISFDEACELKADSDDCLWGDMRYAAKRFGNYNGQPVFLFYHHMAILLRVQMTETEAGAWRAIHLGAVG